MMDMFILLVGVSVFEVLLLYLITILDKFWIKRVILSEVVIGLSLSSFPFIFVFLPSVVFKVLFFIFQLLVVLLASRLIFGRLDNDFLRKSTKKNIWMILGSFVVVVLVSLLFIYSLINLSGLLLVTLSFSAVVAAIFVYQGVWTLKHFRLRKLAKHIPMKELPTVTLAIPARNETHVMSECLSAAVASDYPKLEILVLDDCSQDKTSAIIRAFAQEGVRFVQGKMPTKGWLGKNQAYETLLENASGEYVVFSGVDTRLSKQTISKLVSYALSNDVNMVSVLPQKRDGFNFSNLFIQLRYYWQIVLPISRKRVPVASQLWMIKAEALYHLGNFSIVQDMIVPEGHFARKLFSEDEYRFIVSNSELGATTSKRWSSHMETALRFLYPTFKRQPIYVLLACLLLVGFMMTPFAVFTIGLIFRDYNLHWLLSVIASLIILISYGLVMVRMIPKVWFFTVLMLPFSLIQEFILLLFSMILYEFGEVNWKGRNVCYPVISTKTSRRRKASK